jgi:hypothetical protein
MLNPSGGGRKPEKTASIHSHQQSGAARIRTFGNHHSGRENKRALLMLLSLQNAALIAIFFSRRNFPAKVSSP